MEVGTEAVMVWRWGQNSDGVEVGTEAVMMTVGTEAGVV